MSNIKKLMMSAAGGGGLDVDEVFSTYLYEGNASTQTITNGLDLSGEGGLVWVKGRSGTAGSSGWGGDIGHTLFDSSAPQKPMNTAKTNPRTNFGAAGVNFTSTGFTVGWNGFNDLNYSGFPYASWSFRKAPKFFDIVTYTGNGPSNTQNISHNLGAAPGMMIVKSTSAADNWHTWHRGFGDNGYIMLNMTNAKSTYADLWDDTAPTSTHFTVSDSCNTNNATYVAYLFAHNDGDGEFGPDGDQDIIKCGSYTGNSSATDGPEIDLGFEPQWVMVKKANLSGSWYMFDSMRGMTAGGSDDRYLQANTADAEDGSQDYIGVLPNGFQANGSGGHTNASNGTYIYIAIRRSAKAPESATDVFALDDVTAAGGTDVTTNFPVDTQLQVNIGSSYQLQYIHDRLRGVSTRTENEGRDLEPNNLNTESNVSQTRQWGNTGFQVPSGLANFRTVYYNWKRAPGYFDVTTWKIDGTGNQTIKHNLGVIPEMLWSKNRNDSGNGSGNWWVVHKDMPGWSSSNENDRHVLKLHNNEDSEQQGYHRDFTATSIRLISNGVGGYTTSHRGVAWLFASLPGISKVGSYTGNGTSQTIDCGFSSGARFILVKRVDSSGNWYVWDTARGIVAGNDPYVKIDVTAAEVTSNDSVDPANSGFIVNQNSTTNINVSSASYIFYAVA